MTSRPQLGRSDTTAHSSPRILDGGTPRSDAKKGHVHRVAGDAYVTELELVLQIAEQVQGLSLDRDIERRNGGRPLARPCVRSRDRSLGGWPANIRDVKVNTVISMNGTGRAVPVALAARVAAAERFAGAIVSTFEKCEETSVPLSKAQKTTLIEAALVEFDGFEAELSSLMRIADLLSELGRNGHSHMGHEPD